MHMQLITDSDVRNLPVSSRFIAYADAYSTAAIALCEQMTTTEEACTWPNASVVLMLSAHAVELFIKGAVLSRDDSALLEGHDLERLGVEYHKRFPEAEFAWDIPFKTINIGLPEAEMALLRKSNPQPSILYRYPVEKGGKEWRGLYGFEPCSYRVVLKQMRDDFDRIKLLLA